MIDAIVTFSELALIASIGVCALFLNIRDRLVRLPQNRK